MYFLRTQRLGFRTWRADDLELALGLWDDPEVTRFIGGPPGRAAVADRLAREMDTQATHGIQYWPIFLLSSGAHVGCCGLRPYRPEERVHELGVHIARPYWRQGLARDAAEAVVGRAFLRLGARALFAGGTMSEVAPRHPTGRSVQ